MIDMFHFLTGQLFVQAFIINVFNLNVFSYCCCSRKHFFNIRYICDALCDLLPFVQFKKREQRPWRSVTFSQAEVCNFTKSNTPPWVFFTFLKLCKWHQIAQHISFNSSHSFSLLMLVLLIFFQFWKVTT